MSNERKCPDCGAEIPAGAPLGFCPHCELTAATHQPEESPEAPPLARADSADPSLPAGALRYFGDYELLQVLGQGGMGVVYKARQLSLNRMVALKMTLGGRQASASEVQRFRHEAESAARLRHPNIVSIHEVGEHDGQHYFSMDYVEGQDLAALVRVSPLPALRAARYVQIIAEAIHFAHQKGVLHRDLKPSNVLIDLDDQPRVTDFGLAKRIKGDSDLTQTGQVLGAPSFIPPEQAAGRRDAMGPHGDVYALGAILYHLLTGRPPFAAETITATLTQVLNNEPAAPRTLNASIPRDLETISLKCLEKDPERRYPTAKELADELGRFLRGEPILARPIGRAAKIGRWCRRNRPLAIALAAAVALLLSGITATTWQAVRATRAERELQRLLDVAVQQQAREVKLRNDADQERQKALVAQKKAEDSLKEEERQRQDANQARDEAQQQQMAAEYQKSNALASAKWAREKEAEAKTAAEEAQSQRREAQQQRVELEQLMGFVLFDLGAKLKPIGRVDLLQSVAEKATNYYGLEGSSRDPSGRYYAFKNLGQAMALKGESDGALAACTIALTNASQLVHQQASNTIWRLEELVCHQSIGDLLRARGEPQNALAQYQAGLALAQRLAAEHPEEREWQRLCLAGHVKIGDLFWMQGDQEKALANYIPAVTLATNLAAYSDRVLTNLPAYDMDARVQALKTTTAWQRDLSASYSPVGRILIHTWGWSNAYAGCTQGLAFTRLLCEQRSDDHQLASHLALCHDNLGDVLFVTNRFREAQTNYLEARDIRQRLAVEDPSNTEWQHDLLRSHQKLTRVVAAQGTKYKAWAVARVVADAPFGGLWRALKTYYQDVENVLLGGRAAAALAGSSYSTNVARRLAASDPGNTDWQEALAQSHSTLGDLLLKAGKRQSALDEYQAALLIRQTLTRRDATELEGQLRLAHSHAQVAVAQKRLSQSEAALENARSNLAIVAHLSGRWPRNLVLLEGPKLREPNIGRMVTSRAPLSRDQIQDIGAVFSKGFAKAKKAGDKSSASAHDQEVWGDYCLEMAAAEVLFGDIRNAAEHASRAVSVFDRELGNSPLDAACHARLCRARISLGVYQLWGRQFRAAIDTAQGGLKADPTSVQFNAIMALARVGNGQVDDACGILQKSRGLLTGQELTFADAVLVDLRRLHEKGLLQVSQEDFEKLVRAARAGDVSAIDRSRTLSDPSAAVDADRVTIPSSPP